MSQTFDKGQFTDFSQAHSDRLPQFGSPENGNRSLVDMANPSEARLAGRFSQSSGQNGEHTLSQPGHLTFDDPYASTAGNGSWNAQSSNESFGQNDATGGATNAIAGELQIVQELVNIEQDLSNLVSLLETYITAETASNAAAAPQGDAPSPASSGTSNDTGTSTQGGTDQQITMPAAVNNGNTTGSGSNDSTSGSGSNDSTSGSGSNGNTSGSGSNDNTPGSGSNDNTSGSVSTDNTSSASNNSSTDNPNPIVTTNPTTSADTSTGATAGDGSGFQVNNGKITYNGKTLAGVNVSSQYAESVGPQALADQLSTDLPGINVVRLDTSPAGGAFSDDISVPKPESTSDIQAVVQALNAKGIGVIVDNHSGDVNNPDNVALDGNEAQWFATLAQQNLGNNGVMFQPQNEPSGSNQEIVNEQVAVYNAIRATGSNNVVAFDLGGGSNAAPQLSDPSAYDSMSNYAFDAHAYIVDSNSVSYLPGELAQTASLTEANGQAVPVYFGETGNAISPPTIDNGSDQLLQAEYTSGDGAIAYNFDHAPFALDGSSQADNMLDGNGNLNAYGQFIASLIQQSNNSASG